MADKLLIRLYDVGLGDCIYCRIPGARDGGNGPDDFHMLIDCGTWSGMPLLAAALKDLAQILPDAGQGKKRLDLIVVTHEHKDHIAGFDPALFEPFAIGAIWMNAAMDPEHPQAERSRALHGMAMRAMRGLAASSLPLSPELEMLIGLFGIDNDGAMSALRQGLPEANDITPRYVHAGQTNQDLGLDLHGAVIRVLGPENDIDRFYLGKEADDTLRGIMGAAPALALPQNSAQPAALPVPGNISAADFRTLRSRMLSTALAFAELSSKVTNNTSVVLLIEWRSKRLLFVGDAEWDNRFKEGKSNGAWNVMWHERKDSLSGQLDFLKIGHHGSENATPWSEVEDGERSEPGDILDAILPVPAAGQAASAQAVVSTERGKYKTIPRSALLVELGRRIGNARRYANVFAAGGLEISDLPKFGEFEEKWIAKPQPPRTDLERLLERSGFINVQVEA